MMRGWIMAPEGSREELCALGVMLGPYRRHRGYFDACEVSDEALAKLDPLWGKFFWGLSSGRGERGGPAFARETYEAHLDPNVGRH